MNGTYLSLFSGIGGLDLAVESLGFRCVGQVEYDDACTRILGRWWLDVPRWGDITGFTAAAYAESSGIGVDTDGGAPDRPPRVQREGLPQDVGDAAGRRSPDLIIGGFPCQPASTAGRRKGTADDRWLWPEFARVIGELGPRAVLVENVPGLLTVNGGRAFSEVIGTLADLGYDSTWTSLRAADVGACHRRERLFLLADAGCLRRDAGLVAERGETEGGGSRGEPLRRDRRFPWGAYGPAIERWERVLMRPAPHPVDDKGRLSPAFVEWMMGFPAGWTSGSTRTQALKQLGNAVVPQQGAAALSALTDLELVA